MTEDDEQLRPFNGHYKSEALPNGCAIFTVIAIGFILVMGAYGFIADAMKRPTSDQLYGCTIQQQAPNGDCP